MSAGMIQSILRQFGFIPEDPEEPVDIEKVPPELLVQIISNMDVSTMAKFCSLDQYLIDFCKPLWEKKYQLLYGEGKQRIDDRLSWKENLTKMSVIGFGRNDRGQLGLGNRVNKYTPVIIPNSSFQEDNQKVKMIQISAGFSHTVCLDEHGHVWTWGDDFKNQTGHYGLSDILRLSMYLTTPKRIDPNDFSVYNPNTNRRIPVKITQVSAGHFYTMCLDADGYVWSFGENDEGQLGIRREILNIVKPRRNLHLTDIKQVSAGGSHTIYLDKNGNVYVSGDNSFGQLGLGIEDNIVAIPQKIDSRFFSVDGQPAQITQVSAGAGHTVCLDKNGNVWTFGLNSGGQLGLGIQDKVVRTPQMVGGGTFIIDNIVQVSAGGFHTICLNDKGEFWAFGRNNHGQLGFVGFGGNIEFTPTMSFSVPPGITQVSAGYEHTAFLDENGKLYTSGLNKFGQIGFGQIGPEILSSASWLGSVKGIKSIQVSAGGEHTMLIGI